jgi:uncharacterized BrkB/YihY/UPF0761 family membrane protein
MKKGHDIRNFYSPHSGRFKRRGRGHSELVVVIPMIAVYVFCFTNTIAVSDYLSTKFDTMHFLSSRSWTIILCVYILILPVLIWLVYRFLSSRHPQKDRIEKWSLTLFVWHFCSILVLTALEILGAAIRWGGGFK